MTDLANGERVSKGDPRIILAGKIDSLVAYLALVKLIAKNQSELLLSILKYLMQLTTNLEMTDSALVARMEEQIDLLGATTGWSYPSSNLKAAIINIARTVAREVEGVLVTTSVKNSISVINRLSDYLFSLYKNFESS
jgi:cob(I)alamin adenosyltransferase